MIEYKDSGIEWLGTIPAHWEVKRLKDVTTLNPNYVGGNCVGDVSFVPMESLRLGQIDYQDISFDEAKGKYTFFANEDLLIAKVTPCFENGNIAIAKNLKQGIGFGSSEIFVLRCFDISNNYMFYYSLSSQFQGQACATMCGVGGLKRISPLFMRTYKFAVPPLTEQQAIADYLDKKTAEIDTQISLLENKQKAYEKLKQSLISEVVTCGLNPAVALKDSGIDWIGEIPTHWEVKRLKDVAYLYSGLTGKAGDDFTTEYEQGTKPYIPFTNVLNNNEVNPNNLGYVRIYKDDQQNRVQKNDLLFLMSSEDYESIAKSAVVSEDIEEVYLNSFCRGLRLKSKQIDSKFLNYLLSANKCRDALRFEARGFTRINIKIDKISSHFIFYPPIEEQQDIVYFLDKKTAEINENITLIDRKIKAYRRLKQSLIDEVITGKRKI